MSSGNLISLKEDMARRTGQKNSHVKSYGTITKMNTCRNIFGFEVHLRNIAICRMKKGAWVYVTMTHLNCIH